MALCLESVDMSWAVYNMASLRMDDRLILKGISILKYLNGDRKFPHFSIV